MVSISVSPPGDTESTDRSSSNAPTPAVAPPVTPPSELRSASSSVRLSNVESPSGLVRSSVPLTRRGQHRQAQGCLESQFANQHLSLHQGRQSLAIRQH